MFKLTTVFILLSTLLLQAADYGKAPESIDDCFKMYAQEYFDQHPLTGANLGITPEMGFTYRKDEIGTLTIKDNRYFDFLRKYDNLFRQYDRAKLTDDQKLYLDIMLYSNEQDFRTEKYQWHWYMINSYNNFHLNLYGQASITQVLENRAEVENFLARYRKFAALLPDIRDEMQQQADKNIIPPVYIADIFLKTLSDFIAPDPANNSLSAAFKAEIGGYKFLTAAEKTRYSAEFVAVMKEQIYPQYSEMIEIVKTAQAKADRKAGVWKLPDGDQFYKAALFSNDIDMDPSEIHDLGIREVKRIQAEVLKICAKYGFTEGKKFGEIETAMYKYLKTVPGMRYEQNDSTASTILKDYQQIIDKIYTKLPEVFSVLPKAKVRVETIPDYKVASSGAYYESPSIDGKRPGVFFTNASGGNKYGMRDLAIHEAIPGHHLQLAVGLESHQKPMAMNFLNFTAFLEGWALYCERLGMEQGWYESDYELFGYYMSELYRAARLVVDTGMHYKKWSRQEAADYLIANVGWASESELNRYILWPGQACAYKIGEQKILKLREKAKKELGDRFDIKDFHTAVLKNGAVPLKMLERQVDDYIELKKVR